MSTKQPSGGLEALRQRWLEMRAHTYSSENADLYRGFDNGLKHCADALAPHIAAAKEREEKLHELIVCVQGLLAWKDKQVVGRYDTIGPFGYIRDTDGSRKQIKLVESAVAAILGGGEDGSKA
jgi:hypothetical protein